MIEDGNPLHFTLSPHKIHFMDSFPLILHGIEGYEVLFHLLGIFVITFLMVKNNHTMDNLQVQPLHQQKCLNQLSSLAAHSQELDQYPLPALVLQTSHSFPLQSTMIFPLGSRFTTLPATSKDDYTKFMLEVCVGALDKLCLFLSVMLGCLRVYFDFNLYFN